jgi:hypothetical protein
MCPFVPQNMLSAGFKTIIGIDTTLLRYMK